MAVLAAIASLTAIGWWTQWLLMSALWWGAFLQRHQAINFASVPRGAEHGQSGSFTRRLVGALETPRAMAARRLEKHRNKPAPTIRPRKDADAPGPGKTAGGAGSLQEPAEPKPPDSSPIRGAESRREELIAQKRTQLQRIHRASEEAREGGQSRRASELRIRGERVAAEIDRLRGSDAHPLSPSDGPGERTSGQTPADRLATPGSERLAPGSASAKDGGKRDYAALSRLAGYGREEYERLDAKRRRGARLEIDRALALREELSDARPDPSVGTGRRRLGAAEQTSQNVPRRADRGSEIAPRPRGPESIVMREAREVESGRKRQLGRDRP